MLRKDQLGIYDEAVHRHLEEVAPALRRIDEQISRTAANDLVNLAILNTMRVLLLSGLFDLDHYLSKYADVGQAQADPLQHYVQRGDQEGRMPNPIFLPNYYRSQYMHGVPAGVNTLEHYIHEGERSGAKPNPAFDPQLYLRENGLKEFVDKPSFHFLKIGLAAGDEYKGALGWRFERPLMEYVYVERDENLLEEAKPLLVAGFGVCEGFAKYKKAVGRPDDAEVYSRPLVGMREIARAAPSSTYYETSPGGRPFTAALPRIVGNGGELGPRNGTSRSIFIARFDDVRVRAGSGIIEYNRLALVDLEPQEFTQLRSMDWDPSVFHWAGQTVWIITPQGYAAAFEVEEAFTLLGVLDNHFGHWLIEHLPKYIAASMSNVLPRMPLLVPEADPWLRRSLELVCPEGTEFIQIPRFATVHVRRLWCASAIQNHRVSEMAPAEEYGLVVREMAARARRAVGATAGPKRVFLARSSYFPRKHVNSPAIETVASAREFTVIYPERLDFAQQIRMARDAQFIVGQAGSAMLLAFFAKRGAKVCMLGAPESVYYRLHQTAILQEFGLDVVFYAGRRTRLAPELWESDYEIDELEFSRFLDDWLGE